MAIQLEFFKRDELELKLFDLEKKFMDLERKLNETKESAVKVRKCVFAKTGELEKKFADLPNRIEIMERNICRG